MQETLTLDAQEIAYLRRYFMEGPAPKLGTPPHDEKTARRLRERLFPEMKAEHPHQ